MASKYAVLDAALGADGWERRRGGTVLYRRTRGAIAEALWLTAGQEPTGWTPALRRQPARATGYRAVWALRVRAEAVGAPPDLGAALEAVCGTVPADAGDQPVLDAALAAVAVCRGLADRLAPATALIAQAALCRPPTFAPVLPPPLLRPTTLWAARGPRPPGLSTGDALVDALLAPAAPLAALRIEAAPATALADAPLPATPSLDLATGPSTSPATGSAPSPNPDRSGRPRARPIAVRAIFRAGGRRSSTRVVLDPRDPQLDPAAILLWLHRRQRDARARHAAFAARLAPVLPTLVQALADAGFVPALADADQDATRTNGAAATPRPLACHWERATSWTEPAHRRVPAMTHHGHDRVDLDLAPGGSGARVIDARWWSLGGEPVRLELGRTDDQTARAVLRLAAGLDIVFAALPAGAAHARGAFSLVPEQEHEQAPDSSARKATADGTA